MTLFMYQGSYTTESLAAQLRQPTDRIEAIKPMFDAVGAEIRIAGFSMGKHDLVIIYEAPGETAAAALAIIVGASEAAKEGKTTRLLTSQEWVASLQKAQTAAPQYKPPR